MDVNCVKIDAALYFGRKEISMCTFHIYCTISMKFGITELHKIFAVYPIFIARFE